MEFKYSDNINNCMYKDTCKHWDKGNNTCPLVFCQRHYKMEFLMHQACLPLKCDYPIVVETDSNGTDLEEFKQLSKIKKEVLDFVGLGRNLVIWSKICGNGKTSWAKKILVQYLDSIWHNTEYECRGLFVDLSRFLNELKGTFGGVNSEYVKHVRENIVKADLVVWDEIGLKSISETEIEYLLNFFNTRLTENKANIFTTNKVGKELSENIKERLYSRIVNSSKTIELKGKDKRNLSVKW